MSVTSTVAKSGPFLITALPQIINTGFPFDQGSELLVLDSGPTGLPYDPAVVLTLGSDYTVSGGGYNSANQLQPGSITVVSTGINSVAINDRLVILRNVPINQPDSFESTGPLTLPLIEQALDRQATVSQEINETVGRALRFEKDEFNDGTLLRDLRSGNLLGFDANGNVFFFAPASGGGSTFYTAGTGLLLAANEFSVDPFQTLSGLTVANEIVSIQKLDPELGYPTGGSVTLRFDIRTNNYIGLTTNANFTFGGMVSGSIMILNLRNTTGGILTLTWPSNVNVTGSSLPTSIPAGRSVVIRAEAYGTGLTDVYVQCVSSAGSVTAGTMTLMKGLGGLIDGQVVTLLGYNAVGDGGGGDFFWDAASVDADNSGTIIQLTAGGNGRFKRIIPGTSSAIIRETRFDVRWFGAIPDFATAVEARVQLAYNALPSIGVGTLYFPAGNYLFNGSVVCNSGKKIVICGDGVTSTRFIYNTNASSMWAIGDAVDMHDIEFVNVNGTNPNMFVLISCFGSLSKLRDLRFGAFYNIILIKISTGYADVSNINAANLNGCQLWIEGAGGLVTNCTLSAGDSVGISYWPCMVIRGIGGNPITSLKVSHCILKGSGPWTPYDAGTLRSILCITTDGGVVHECSFSDLLLDTTSGTGNEPNTVSVLCEGVSGGGAYDVGGIHFSDLYCNGGREGLRIEGVDMGGAAKTAQSFVLTNIYTLPTTGIPGVRLKGCKNVSLVGGIPAGTGGGTGLLIEAQGSNYTEDIYFSTPLSCAQTPGFGSNPTAIGVEVAGSLTRNIHGHFSAWGVTSAPYVLSGGASKANGISFMWPDATGGVNFSGAVNTSV